MRYLFFLGREPHISHAELRAVFSADPRRPVITSSTKSVCVVTSSQHLDIPDMMSRLGGTVKIAEEISSRHTSWQEVIIEHLTETQSDGKIQFALSGQSLPTRAGLEMKKRLKETGRNVRYIEIKNTASILHNHLVEKQGDLTVYDNRVFVTRAIQPIEEFSERDFGRPGSDDVSGMLPPKLAKILINIAGTTHDATLLDPFCGSGTILMEAAVMGYTHLIGTDISPKAIDDTQKNLEWIRTKTPQNTFSADVSVHDVRTLDKYIPHRTIDTIVTEPFLGKPKKGRETKEELMGEAQELATLYRDAFRVFERILTPQGIVVITIPTFRYKQEWITVPCLPDIKNIGFSPMPFDSHTTHLLYHRPTQYVGRTIWKFTKQ